MQIKKAISYLENNEEQRIAAIYIRIKKMAINALKKQEEYEQLEEQGLLIKLPCRVGDTVYVLWSTYNTATGTVEYDILEEEFEVEMIDDFGEYAFLTKEEAEQALKKLQEGRNDQF